MYLLFLLGCMAERLKDKLLEKEQSVDVIAGPDSYRQLPLLLSEATSHQVDNIWNLKELFSQLTFFY